MARSEQQKADALTAKAKNIIEDIKDGYITPTEAAIQVIFEARAQEPRP